MNKHYWLYVLKLQQNKYYVGITSKTPEVRYKQHKSGFAGAAWTKAYKPIKIIDRKDLGYVSRERAERFETKVAAKYMRRYGINNVRGGSFNETDPYISILGFVYVKEPFYTGILIIFLSILCLFYALKDVFTS